MDIYTHFPFMRGMMKCEPYVHDKFYVRVCIELKYGIVKLLLYWNYDIYMNVVMDNVYVNEQINGMYVND